MMSDRMNISIMAGALSADPREALSRSRGIGFGGVVFDAVTPTIDLADLSVTGRREFRHVVQSAGQTLVALRADLGRDGFSPGVDIDQALARLDRVLQVARDLTTTCVTIDLGPLPSAIEAEAPKKTINPEEAGLIIIPSAVEPAAVKQERHFDPPDPAFVAQVNAALLALGQLADRYQVVVALSTSLGSFASLARAMSVANCPWFGVDL